MVTGAIISLLIVAAALILSGFFSLERRVSRLEEEHRNKDFEPIEVKPDKLFLEWIYGGDE